MNEKQIDAYIDYKSPYAYLAIEPTRELERDYWVRVNWLPYTLDIPDYLGSARVDEEGRVMEEDRTPHQWRKVRYSYMDVRRYANLRGLTVRGPQKIWDSSVAAVGLLYAKEQGVLRKYTDTVYERFWRRELDIEDPRVVQMVLEEAGADVGGFLDYLAGEGRRAHDRIRAEAEARGVFGVPTYVLNEEVFWGREHLSLIRLRLHDQGLSRTGAGAPIDVTFARRGEPVLEP